MDQKVGQRGPKKFFMADRRGSLGSWISDTDLFSYSAHVSIEIQKLVDLLDTQFDILFCFLLACTCSNNLCIYGLGLF